MAMSAPVGRGRSSSSCATVANRIEPPEPRRVWRPFDRRSACAKPITQNLEPARHFRSRSSFVAAAESHFDQGGQGDFHRRAVEHARHTRNKGWSAKPASGFECIEVTVDRPLAVFIFIAGFLHDGNALISSTVFGSETRIANPYAPVVWIRSQHAGVRLAVMRNVAILLGSPLGGSTSFGAGITGILVFIAGFLHDSNTLISSTVLGSETRIANPYAPVVWIRSQHAGVRLAVMRNVAILRM